MKCLPEEIAGQTMAALDLLRRNLQSSMQAVYLFGSALGGGLKPLSDIDLLVVIRDALDAKTRRNIMLDLLEASLPPGISRTLRPLEVTIVAHSEVVPWRYPAKRELQFGEWLRKDILSGVFESAVQDHDLALLLTKVRHCSLPLFGPDAEEQLEPVPDHDLMLAMYATLKQWNAASDWAGDERNVILALARMWYTASTSLIVPKDVAASWLLEQLPAEHKPIMRIARDAYLGLEDDSLAANPQTAAFILFARSELECLIKKSDRINL